MTTPKTAHLYWHSRGYLPHCDTPGMLQAITFRLADALPQDVLIAIQRSAGVLARQAAPTNISNKNPRSAQSRLIDQALDAGYGQCWLKQPAIAQCVQNALYFGDGSRYRLLDWCIMPNHVHTLIETHVGWPLHKVVADWKSVTARQINILLKRSGSVWMADYFDRFIRDDTHLQAVRTYIHNNPVKAGLVDTPSAWRYSSAYIAGEDARAP